MSSTRFWLTIYLWVGPAGILTVGLVMAFLLLRETRTALRRGGGLFGGGSAARGSASGDPT